MKLIKRLFKIIGIVITSLIVIFCLLIAGIAIYDPIGYSGYYKLARKEFRIPGLNSGFTPQGLAYSKEKNVFLGSGYDKKTGEAVIYVIDQSKNTSKKVGVMNGDKVYKGHAGGIAVNKDFVYLANNSKILCLSLNDIMNAKENDKVKLGKSFVVPVNSAFCFADSNALYVGEFYDIKHNYNTNSSHHIELDDGTTNHSLIVKYDLDASNSDYGVNIVPKVAYSVTDQVQGCAVSPNGRMALSISWGISSSHIMIYKDINASLPITYTFTQDGDSTMYILPTYILSGLNLEKDVVAPPMSEDLEYIDGRVYIFNESASNKYIFGKFMRSKNVYSYPMD